MKNPNPLHEWRESLGMSQADFAQHLARLRGSTVTQAQVSVWESWGPISKSSLAVLAQVSEGRFTVEAWWLAAPRRRRKSA